MKISSFLEKLDYIQGSSAGTTIPYTNHIHSMLTHAHNVVTLHKKYTTIRARAFNTR